MKNRKYYDHNNHFSSKAEERIFLREELSYNVTEDFLVIMEDNSISKKELARRLGKSKSYITQILSGSRNMTLGTLSDICNALGFKPKIQLPVEESYASTMESADTRRIIQIPQKTRVEKDIVKSNIFEFPNEWRDAS